MISLLHTSDDAMTSPTCSIPATRKSLSVGKESESESLCDEAMSTGSEVGVSEEVMQPVPKKEGVEHSRYDVCLTDDSFVHRVIDDLEVRCT